MSAFSKKKRGSDVVSISKLIDLIERYQNGSKQRCRFDFGHPRTKEKLHAPGVAHRLNWCQL